jgi:hypothetical protein
MGGVIGIVKLETLQAVSGVGGLAVAFVGIGLVLRQVRLLREQITQAKDEFASEREHVRRQSTLEFMATTQERRSHLQTSVPAGSNAERVNAFLADLRSDAGGNRRRDLSRYLSYYETLAVGANTGVLDVDIVERAWGSVLVRSFAAYRAYIEERRATLRQPTLYREYETLVETILQKREGRPPSTDTAAGSSAPAG